MKFTLSTIFSGAATAALISTLPAQDRPKDFDHETPQLEHHLHDLGKPTDAAGKALIEEIPSSDDDWDMVRRLEKMRKDQSQDAMIQRLVDEAMSEMKLERIPGIHSSPGPNHRIIGVEAEDLTGFVRSHLSIADGQGVRVLRVLPNSPAAKSGIAPDDILLRANKRKLDSVATLKEAVSEADKNGKALKFAVIRKGKRMAVTIEPRNSKRKDAPKRTVDQTLKALQKRVSRQEKMLNELRRDLAQLRAAESK